MIKQTELQLGDTLRRLRRERNLTQETLASHLGISCQAISKWERSDGYPDITFLPVLARYFGISVDTLLGMDEIAAQERLAEYNCLWKQNRAERRHAENVELMRQALGEFPNHPLLLVQLSASLERLDGTSEERRAHLYESIMVQERILTYCDDSEVRGAVMWNIADSYDRYGDRERARMYAEKLPNLYKTRESALIRLTEDEEEKRWLAAEAMERMQYLLSQFLPCLYGDQAEEKLREIKNIV